ncbi:MAG: glycoside hydrolase family 44 protein [Candidatus Binatus sp.]|uniref:glycoside hydrolase family 44 protein n=1 Tax=Candidatus Binatus sp. TaxID=2811406 RepID=UPI0027211EEC|nr:glycoside hydrolase family 44 protein [Candidatus Binatus sp.]MDO8434072.1 glycoside hydrolase family 44 protein [Candidatus Binatus sp.]
MSRSALIIVLLGSLASGNAFALNAPVTININVNAGRRPISPLVYGVSEGYSKALANLSAPLNRSGGNNATRYNWLINARNLDADWYYESYPYASATPGGAGDDVISQSRLQGAQAMLTIPMIGWVAKLGASRAILSSFSVAKYGSQCSTDPWLPNAGNGVKADCHTNVTGNNPNDANVADNSTTEQAWVKHLVAKWGTAAQGGLAYYLMDNESSIWFSSHRDVHPVGAHATEIRDKVIDYSAKIKAIDPGAKIVAPEEWGWDGYRFSGYDQQYSAAHNWSAFPDRQNVMGGQDYMPWLLSQWKAAGRPIDIFSLHFYPQGGEFSNNVSASMQLLRNRSTRQLWDPNYVSESWIDDKVDLIPRMGSWVNSKYYPGTPIALTEYNWGAEGHINGATTQADLLGIFGRYGLSMATRWTVPNASTPTYKAMQMYRNYNGSRGAFGDTSISAVVPNPDQLSAFAAQRTPDSALTVMVINKVLSGSTPITLTLANFTVTGSAQVYQLSASNAITHLANQAWSGGTLKATVPPQSITLYVLPKY